MSTVSGIHASSVREYGVKLIQLFKHEDLGPLGWGEVDNSTPHEFVAKKLVQRYSQFWKDDSKLRVKEEHKEWLVKLVRNTMSADDVQIDDYQGLFLDGSYNYDRRQGTIYLSKKSYFPERLGLVCSWGEAFGDDFQLSRKKVETISKKFKPEYPGSREAAYELVTKYRCSLPLSLCFHFPKEDERVLTELVNSALSSSWYQRELLAGSFLEASVFPSGVTTLYLSHDGMDGYRRRAHVCSWIGKFGENSIPPLDAEEAEKMKEDWSHKACHWSGGWCEKGSQCDILRR